jgi:phosphosulfolactate synthase
MSTTEYLREIGVADLPPRTTPFDPGYDLGTVKEHLRQSAHLMAGLKISMACWQIANEDVTREKIAACKEHGVKTSAGGGPLEVAAYFDKLESYMRLCADVGLDRIEAGEGFIKNNLTPHDLVAMASDHGLEVQFELGEKHAGAFDDETVDALLRQGQKWLDAGAKQLVIEARENAAGVGLFDEKGVLNGALAQKFMQHFGEERTVYEAPIKKSQFALMDYFGPRVYLGNIRLEEVLRVEIYRRGLHSDAFQRENLRPKGPSGTKRRKT